MNIESFVFFNIYFPNGGRGMEWVERKLVFYKKFLEVAQGYQQAGRPVVVTGDFNTAFAAIDLARPKENVNTSGFMPVEREGLGEFFTRGMVDTFRYLHPDTVKYTYWDQVTRARERNVGWRIDYFMVTTRPGGSHHPGGNPRRGDGIGSLPAQSGAITVRQPGCPAVVFFPLHACHQRTASPTAMDIERGW